MHFSFPLGHIMISGEPVNWLLLGLKSSSGLAGFAQGVGIKQDFMVENMAVWGCPYMNRSYRCRISPKELWNSKCTADVLNTSPHTRAPTLALLHLCCCGPPGCLQPAVPKHPMVGGRRTCVSQLLQRSLVAS